MRKDGREHSDRAWGTRAIGKSGPVTAPELHLGQGKGYGIHMWGLPPGHYPVHVSCPGYDDFTGEIHLIDDSYHYHFPINLTKSQN